MTVSRSTIGMEYLITDKDTHFSGAIAQNAGEAESIDFPESWGNINITEVVITGIVIESDQNLEWDVELYSSDEFDNTDLDLDAFVGRINFPATNGKQYAGANQYLYDISDSNIEIPYKSNDSKLHIILVNRSASSKNAGATGEVVIKFKLRPVYGV